MEPQTAISTDDDTRTDMQVEETSLPLRHRLFPRAMAWNVAATLPTAEWGAANDTIKTARFAGSVPAPMLLRPTLEGVGLLPAKRQHTEAPERYVYRQPTPDQALPFGARPPTTDDRQRLFSTIGKWLDGNVPQEYASRPHSHLIHNSPQMSSPTMSTPTGLSPRVEMVRIDITPVHPRVSPIDMPATSKKRQRGPSGSTVPPNGVVARPASTSSGPKRCSVLNCGKIAVSKGLCRGHGGGRRCTFPGCTKCAQSRSPFCWAHGGGKRCEAPNCRRSRKTKRFCVDHVEMEHTVPLATDSDDSIAGSYPTSDTDSTTSTQVSGASIVHHLPSLSDALKRTISAAKATAMKNNRSTTLPQTREHLWPTC